MKKYFYLIISSLLIVSCDDFSNSPVELFHQNSDSLSYNEKGELEGLQKWFFPDSNYVLYENYVSGKREGKARVVYLSNSQVKYTGQYANSNEVGEWIYFHLNGTIEGYQYYLPDGKLGYMRIYGNNDSLLSVHGEPFLYINGNRIDDDFKIGDSLEINVHFAKPPHCKSRLDILLGLKGDSTLDVWRYEPQSTRIYYKNEFKHLGENMLKIDWILKDTLNDKVETGTTKYIYQVR